MKYGLGHKKVPIKKRLCKLNFAFRVRVRSVVQISMFKKLSCNGERTVQRTLKECCG